MGPNPNFFTKAPMVYPEGPHLADRAEHLAELAEEAETKKEADAYWREYRAVMIRMTGDPNLFKARSFKPTRKQWDHVSPCPCGSSHIKWERRVAPYVVGCGCVGSGYTGKFVTVDGVSRVVRTCSSCGKSGAPQRTGFDVQFVCQSCGKTSGWCATNEGAIASWLKPEAP